MARVEGRRPHEREADDLHDAGARLARTLRSGDAIVRWGAETMFLARFDNGWLVTAAGCTPRGKDLPYDCSIEGR